MICLYFLSFPTLFVLSLLHSTMPKQSKPSIKHIQTCQRSGPNSQFIALPYTSAHERAHQSPSPNEPLIHCQRVNANTVNQTSSQPRLHSSPTLPPLPSKPTPPPPLSASPSPPTSLSPPQLYHTPSVLPQTSSSPPPRSAARRDIEVPDTISL